MAVTKAKVTDNEVANGGGMQVQRSNGYDEGDGGDGNGGNGDGDGDDDGDDDDDEDDDVDNAGARDDRWTANGVAAADPALREHNERIFRRLMPNYRPTKEPMSCELCGDVFGTPVSYHMLTTHPGCGHSSGGRGYTSNGTYKTGWSGACGEGGIAWYLLCEECRGNYMRRAAASPGPVRSRKTAAVLRHACPAAVAAMDDVVANRRQIHRGESTFFVGAMA